MPSHVSTPFRAVMTAASPVVRGWGRLSVSGLEHLPSSGPTLLAGNHDSWWDPVVIGIAAVQRRQIKALAKSSLWKNGLVAKVLDGMGQIPIGRGTGEEYGGALFQRVRGTRDMVGMLPTGQGPDGDTTSHTVSSDRAIRSSSDPRWRR